MEDGRFFPLASNRKFDIITAEPPPPKGAGIVNLYSKEYFRLIRNRLAPGGIATYWLPVYQMSNAESKAIMRGFCEVFEDCSLWTGIGLEWMLIGTNGASGPVSDAEFGAQWADPMVGPEMRNLALETPESLAATFLGDARTLRELTAGVPPLEDDHPLRVSSRVPPAVDPFYVDFMTRTPVEATFESSDLIRRLMPPATRQRTLAAFETQRRIDLVEARRLTGVRTFARRPGRGSCERGAPSLGARVVHRVGTGDPCGAASPGSWSRPPDGASSPRHRCDRRSRLPARGLPIRGRGPSLRRGRTTASRPDARTRRQESGGSRHAWRGVSN